MTILTNRKNRKRGRVVFLRRNRIEIKPPEEVRRDPDPIVDSIGALKDFPLWDEFMAAIEENRQRANLLVDEE